MAKMQAEVVRRIKERALQQAVTTIRNRIDELGVREPIVQQQKVSEGAQDRILIQLPGIKDVSKAKDIIGQTALLEFRLVIDGPGDRSELLQSQGGKLPKNAPNFSKIKVPEQENPCIGFWKRCRSHRGGFGHCQNGSR